MLALIVQLPPSLARARDALAVSHSPPYLAASILRLKSSFSWETYGHSPMILRTQNRRVGVAISSASSSEPGNASRASSRVRAPETRDRGCDEPGGFVWKFSRGPE